MAQKSLSPKSTSAERAALERRLADPALPRGRAARAQIALAALDGATNSEIAAQVGVTVPTVTLWRRRYAELGIAGLDDRPRSGRPRTLGASALPKGTPGAAEPGDDGAELLLRAAARTIARRGFAATRMADVAAEAGIAPATVHYHFKTREEILVRALVWAHERLIVELEDAIAGTDDPVERVAMLIERTVPRPGVRRDEYLLELDLWSQVRLHRELLPAWERYEERWMAHVVAMIQAGIDSGDFSSVAGAAVIAERLVAMTDGLAAQTAIGAARMPAERVRSLVIEFVAEQLTIDLERLERAGRVLHALQEA